MSDMKYLNFCKALSCLIYTFVITRFMDFTFSVYPNVSFVSRLLFFIIIGSFMYFFFADKIKSAEENFVLAEDLEIQTNLLMVESVFVHLYIIYLFLVFILKISIPFLELDIYFNIIPENKYIKYIVLFIFLWLYVRYFIVLLLSGFFAFSNIRNIIMGKFKR